MTNEERIQRAVELFKSGYNCSQAVVAAYADLYGFTEEQAFRMAASFGGGIGRMRQTCGAACGLFLLAGLETGAVDGADQAGKSRNYEVVQALAEQFRQENGSIICADLLGLNKQAPTPHEPEARTPEYYKKRPCEELVGISARIVGEKIAEMDK
jgi:C_GCAxxG_C_C family probable redox protein